MNKKITAKSLKAIKKILIQKTNQIFFNNFSYIKIWQRNIKILRKEARERYQYLSKEEKDKRRKKVRDRYQNLSEEEKEKKHQYDLERNKNLSEEQKQKQVEDMRNYYLTHKK